MSIIGNFDDYEKLVPPIVLFSRSSSRSGPALVLPPETTVDIHFPIYYSYNNCWLTSLEEDCRGLGDRLPSTSLRVTRPSSYRGRWQQLSQGLGCEAFF